MQRREIVTLTRIRDEPGRYAQVAESSGYEVQETSVSLILRAPLEVARFEVFSRALVNAGLEARIRRSVVAEYETNDWKVADLLAIDVPEVELGTPDPSVCPACGQQLKGRAPFPILREVKWSAEFVAIVGVGWAVSAGLRHDLEDRQVRGGVFSPCDPGSTAFWLGARSELVAPRFAELDRLGDFRLCAACDSVTQGIAFGPARFRRTRWNHDDIVFSRFHQTPIVSHRALLVLQEWQPDVEATEPIWLE